MNLGLSLSMGMLGGSRFLPSSLAGIAHWYRGDHGITIATGVSQWSDQIGTAHLLQATGANQPSYNAADAAYNNQPTIQASATTHYLASGASVNAQPLTIWAVGEFSTASGTLAATSAGGTPPIIFNSGGTLIINAGSTLSSGVAAAAKHATLATYNGASSFVGVDNWLTGGVSGAAGATNGSAISVLGFTAGANTTVGKIAELILQAGIPTAAEKTAMAAYFLTRYGITVT